MSEQASSTPALLATELFDALNRHDLAEMRPYYHPDVVEDFIAVGEFRGIDAVLGFFSEVFGAFPDIAWHVEQVTGDDEHAVVQWQGGGTFTGTPFQGLHATGRAGHLRGCDVMRFENGELKHNTVYWDGLAFARQLGVLPREGSPADKAMTAALNAATDVRARLRKAKRSGLG